MGFIGRITARDICQRHNGIQAQFQSYADEGFKSRIDESEYAGDWSADLVRQWSIRGTVHAYLKEEIPLYLHEGRRYFNPRLDIPSRDGKISVKDKKYYAQIILEHLESGNKDREELKAVCRKHGLCAEKEKSLFNAWGGIIAVLVSEGLIYQEYGARRFGLLGEYAPLDKNTAELEIARRYFSGFGPVTLNDARYYFKENKSVIEEWMRKLDLQTVEVGGELRYYSGELPDIGGISEIPKVIFVAGFDAMLLAFEKRGNLFFDAKYVRDIYTMTGIVRPVVMLGGQMVATWRRENGKLCIKPFVKLKNSDMVKIQKSASKEYADIVWE